MTQQQNEHSMITLIVLPNYDKIQQTPNSTNAWQRVVGFNWREKSRVRLLTELARVSVVSWADLNPRAGINARRPERVSNYQRLDRTRNWISIVVIRRFASCRWLRAARSPRHSFSPPRSFQLEERRPYTNFAGKNMEHFCSGFFSSLYFIALRMIFSSLLKSRNIPKKPRFVDIEILKLHRAKWLVWPGKNFRSGFRGNWAYLIEIYSTSCMKSLLIVVLVWMRCLHSCLLN